MNSVHTVTGASRLRIMTQSINGDDVPPVSGSSSNQDTATLRGFLMQERAASRLRFGGGESRIFMAMARFPGRPDFMEYLG